MDKEELKNIGIFAGIAIVLFLILFFVNIPVQKLKNAGLAKQIQYVLNVVEGDKYTVSEPVLINSSLQNIATAYRLEVNPSNAVLTGGTTYACILRITGISGPVPAVYIYNTDSGSDFIGIAGLYEAMMEKDKCGITNVQISYWAELINELFETNDFQ